jgi:hypothetical protein
LAFCTWNLNAGSRRFADMTTLIAAVNGHVNGFLKRESAGVSSIEGGSIWIVWLEWVRRFALGATPTWA